MAGARGSRAADRLRAGAASPAGGLPAVHWVPHQRGIELTWDRVNLSERLAYLPTTKTGQARGVYLPDPVLVALADLQHLDGSVFRYSSRYSLRSSWLLMCERAGISNFTPHDCRHTFSTHAAAMGVSEADRAIVLGHGSRTMTGVYTHHDGLPEKRRALNKWADRISAAIADNVVELRPEDASA